MRVDYGSHSPMSVLRLHAALRSFFCMEVSRRCRIFLVLSSFVAYVVIAVCQVLVSWDFLFNVHRWMSSDLGYVVSVLDPILNGMSIYRDVFWNYGPFQILFIRFIDGFFSNLFMSVVFTNLFFSACAVSIVLSYVRSLGGFLVGFLLMLLLCYPLERFSQVNWASPLFLLYFLIYPVFKIRKDLLFLVLFFLLSVFLQLIKPTSPLLLFPFLVTRAFQADSCVVFGKYMIIIFVAGGVLFCLLLSPFYGGYEVFLNVNLPLYMVGHYEAYGGSPISLIKAMDLGTFYNKFSVIFYSFLLGCGACFRRRFANEDSLISFLFVLSGLISILLYFKHSGHHVNNTFPFFIAAILINPPLGRVHACLWWAFISLSLLLAIKLNVTSCVSSQKAFPGALNVSENSNFLLDNDIAVVELRGVLSKHSVKNAAFITKRPGLPVILGVENNLHVKWLLYGFVSHYNSHRFWGEFWGADWVILEKSGSYQGPEQHLASWDMGFKKKYGLFRAKLHASKLSSYSIVYESPSYYLLKRSL